MSGKTITRADLCEAVYQKVGLSRTESAALVELVLQEVTDCLERGETGEAVVVRVVRRAQEGTAYRPQSENRQGSADLAASRDGVQAVGNPEAAHQRHRRGGRKRIVAGVAFSRFTVLIWRKRPWTRRPTLFAPSAKLPTISTSRSTCCGSGRAGFPQIRPMKRAGGRRYYRPDDVDLLRGIRHLLYGQGYTIRGVQRILREQGPKFVQAVWQPGAAQPVSGPSDDGHGPINWHRTRRRGRCSDCSSRRSASRPPKSRPTSRKPKRRNRLHLCSRVMTRDACRPRCTSSVNAAAD